MADPLAVLGLFDHNVSSSTYHGCAVRRNGRLACWGENSSVSVATPTSGSFASVSVGLDAQLRRAARWNHRVLGRARLRPVQRSRPAPSLPLSVGGYVGAVACGLRQDGTAACWGSAKLRASIRPPSGAFSLHLQRRVDRHACGVSTQWESHLLGVRRPRIEPRPRRAPSRSVSSRLEPHACGIRTNGCRCLLALRRRPSNRATPQSGTFTSVSAGRESHSCGIRRERNRRLLGSQSTTASPLRHPAQFSSCQRR